MGKPVDLKEFYEKLSIEGKLLYDQLEMLIDKAQPDVCKMLFVSNPYFYLKKHEAIKPHHRPSIMLVFYKDHVNIFAEANQKYESALNSYKLTDKYTLQISYDQLLLEDVLVSIFKDSLKP
jgi:hypothetical protein